MALLDRFDISRFMVKWYFSFLSLVTIKCRQANTDAEQSALTAVIRTLDRALSPKTNNTRKCGGSALFCASAGIRIIIFFPDIKKRSEGIELVTLSNLCVLQR